MSKFNWSQHNVIVTGGAGFLGSHLVDHLRERGCDSIVVPRSADYDLREKEATQQLFADNPNTDMVFHLAATVGGIGANRQYPGMFIYDNLMMGTHIMEQSRLAGVTKVINMGTICEYPKFTPIPFKEENLWDGYPEETNAPYGIAKKAALVMGKAYAEQYGFNSIHILPTNLYGPRDNFDLATSHVIPAMIRKMIAADERGDDVTLFGDGSPTREFLYVKDAARGIALAAERYNSPEPVNLGSGFEISIRDLAQLIADVVDFRGEIIWDTAKPNGQPRRKVDITRAKSEFGFESEIQFHEGMRESVAWYRANREEADKPLEYHPSGA